MPSGLDTIQQILNEYKTQYDEAKDVIESKTKEMNNAKSLSEALQKSFDEFSQITKKYKQGFAKIQSDKENLESYFSYKKPLLDAAIGDKKENIEAKISEVKEGITDVEQEIRDLKGALNTAQVELDNAKKDRDKKQSDYDAYKTRHSEIGKKLKELNDLKQTIEAEEDKKNIANMYFYILEFKDLLDKLTLEFKNENEFEAALIQSWQTQNQAEKTTREKNAEKEGIEAQIEGKKEELKSKEEKRIQDILEKINE